MTFLWSDAWLFQAIALASRQGPASLGAILGAADAVNHALPTDDEWHGALSRLTAEGMVQEVDGRFQLTAKVPPTVVDAIAVDSWSAGRDAAAAFLGAEPWSPERNTGDPRNAVTYAGLTVERLREAEREYRRSRDGPGA
jgi:hypothetical protein